jgi:hypothetical protein
MFDSNTRRRMRVSLAHASGYRNTAPSKRCGEQVSHVNRMIKILKIFANWQFIAQPG